MWTRESLHDLIQNRLQGLKFIVVSNREPYIHQRVDDEIQCMRPASGMAAALDPIMRAAGGVWVAAASGSADREVVNAADHVGVPPEDPSYILRRVWLDERLHREYYNGLSNEGLWPLCHVAFSRPQFSLRHWKSYREANQLFAEAVLEEAAGAPAFVFIQDYHFGLLPRILKDRNPNLIVAQFWHIPWPNREVFRAFPWGEELLDGLLGNDLLGFHLRYHCGNFVDTVDRGIEAKVDYEHLTVTRGGRSTTVRPFPISIDFDRHSETAASLEVDLEMEQWRLELGLRTEFLGIGIDRLDYTKGIPDRLTGLGQFFEEHPQYRGRLTLIQIGVPSRTEIGTYQALHEEVEQAVLRINQRWGKGAWRPVIFLKGDYPLKRLMALHRLADFCLVTSLHDGMNLVAKEFVASRFDTDGALILSPFTGAARELTDAIIANPYASNEIAAAIFGALTMPSEERHRRMRRMRATVAENNIYRWAGKVLSTLLKFDLPEVPAWGEVEAGGRARGAGM